MAEPSTPPVEPEQSDRPSEQEPKPRGAHKALMIVFLVVFIDLLGFGIVLPLLPIYADVFLKELIPGGAEKWQAGAVIGVLASSFSLMQFLFAPVWGRLSDRVGRRPILLVGLAGSVIFYTLFGIGSEMHPPQWGALGLLLMFAARIGAGVAGATISTAQAVIADSTTPEKRSRGMALIGAAFGIGFTFGPLLGALALWLWPTSVGAPAFAAAAFSLLSLLLGIWLLPETLKEGTPYGRRRLLDWNGIRNALKSPAVGTLVLIFFLATFAFGNFEATASLFIKDVLEYPTEKMYLMFAYIGFMLMVAQGGFYQTLARRGVTEITFVVMGIGLLVLGLAGLIAAAWVAADRGPGDRDDLFWGVLGTIGIAVFGFAFMTPSVQALISRRSDPRKQGEILGVNQSASALARILGPLIGLSVYKVEHTRHVLPYILGTVLLLLVLILVPRVRAPKPAATE